MSFVVYLVNPTGAFYIGLMILVGAAVYFGILVLMRGFGNREVKF